MEESHTFKTFAEAAAFAKERQMGNRNVRVKINRTGICDQRVVNIIQIENQTSKSIAPSLRHNDNSYTENSAQIKKCDVKTTKEKTAASRQIQIMCPATTHIDMHAATDEGTEHQIHYGCNEKKCTSEIVVTFDGKRYTWNGKCWYGDDFIKPSYEIIVKLNELAKNQFEANDAAIFDFMELLDTARRLKEGEQYSRALKLAEHALKIKPDNDGAAAFVCSILRLMNRSDEALKLADNFVRGGSTYLPLLTSRASALCDLNRWPEALRQIRQVLAKSGGRNVEGALLVWSRIKSYAPKLF